MNISLIIPNFNGKDLLEKYLPSILSAAVDYTEGKAEVIIVDDGSTDDSTKFIGLNYPEIKLIIKNNNTGFADSCNIGVEKSEGEIVILLNSDVSPQKDFLNPLIKHFTDQQVFAVGCLEKSFQEGKEILSGKSIGYFRQGLIWHNRDKDQQSFGNTFWVAGGSGAFRKSIWKKLAGFDLIFAPFYWEDIDLSYRAQKAGFKTLFEPKSVVFHNHESTIAKLNSLEDIKVISVRNQLLFFWKNISDAELLFKHLLWIPFNIIKSATVSPQYFIKGLYFALMKIGKLFQQKKINKTCLLLHDKSILANFLDISSE